MCTVGTPSSPSGDAYTSWVETVRHKQDETSELSSVRPLVEDWTVPKHTHTLNIMFYMFSSQSDARLRAWSCPMSAWRFLLWFHTMLDLTGEACIDMSSKSENACTLRFLPHCLVAFGLQRRHWYHSHNALLKDSPFFTRSAFTSAEISLNLSMPSSDQPLPLPLQVYLDACVRCN